MQVWSQSIHSKICLNWQSSKSIGCDKEESFLSQLFSMKKKVGQLCFDTLQNEYCKQSLCCLWSLLSFFHLYISHRMMWSTPSRHPICRKSKSIFCSWRYGLDQPFLVQYFLWIRNILTGNLGFSLVSQSSISQELATRIPNTMRLVIPAYLTALLLAIIWACWLLPTKERFGIGSLTLWHL